MSVMPTKDKATGMYRKMYEIRQYEETVKYLFFEGIMPGTIHQSAGEEATAVGTIYDLRREDVIFSTHRPAGHDLAKGVSLRAMMCEMFGKAEGCCTKCNSPICVWVFILVILSYKICILFKVGYNSLYCVFKGCQLALDRSCP